MAIKKKLYLNEDRIHWAGIDAIMPQLIESYLMTRSSAHDANVGMGIRGIQSEQRNGRTVGVCPHC